MRRLALLALVAAAPAPASLPISASLPPPVTGACISSPFGPRAAHPLRPATFHYGIDFPAAAGTPIHSVAAGTIVAIGRRGAEGLAIDVAHGGYVAVYAHLGMVAIPVVNGQRKVAAGTVLGRVGRTGLTTGPHVHFELHVDGKPVDPAPYVQAAACR